MKFKYVIILLILAMIFPLITKADSYYNGDIDGNGNVETRDFLILRRYLIKERELTSEEFKRSDVNGDGVVNPADYNMIMRILIKKEPLTTTKPTMSPILTNTPVITTEPTMSPIQTNPPVNTSVSKIHFIHTGSSDAILIESGGEFGLVDSANPYNDGTSYATKKEQESVSHVITYLKSLGVKKLRFVIGTHAHSDHIGGMPKIAANFVDSNTTYYYRKYLGTEEDVTLPSWDNQGYYNRAIAAMKKYGATLRDVSGTSPTFSLGDFKIKLMNIGTFHKTRENNNSIVEYITYKGKDKTYKTLLAADMEAYSEMNVANAIGKIDVLKVGHHSYGTGTTFNFVNKLKPKIAVITNNYIVEDLYPVIYHMQTNYKTKVYLTGKEKNAVVVTYTDTGYSVSNSKNKVSNLTKGGYSGNWVKINNKTWALEINGGLAHDYWYKDSNGKWYYINGIGSYATGWQQLTWNGAKSWYYFESSGVMVMDTCKVISGKNYCFAASGSCKNC